MRFCFDIDGVIAENKVGDLTYETLAPIPLAVETLKLLKKNGHYIILATGRHMNTCNANVGRVIATQGKTLLDWLEKHEVPYDELHFGKPHYDLVIDDAAHHHTGWITTMDAISERIAKGPRTAENP